MVRKSQPSLQTAGATIVARNRDDCPPTCRVLIVDDTRASAFVLGKLLETMGQEVCTVYDGASALAQAREMRPDVVISDVAMPEMDGYELARRLRKEPGLESMVLAALTGHSQESDRQQAKAAGFDHHLVKPVSLESLEELLTNVHRATVPQGASADSVGR